MGLSIHYTGSFNKNASLSDLITEVKEVAEVQNWEYNVYEEKFPIDNNEDDTYDGKVYGISFSPPKCEPVFICFLSNYRMSNHLLIEFYGDAERQPEKDYLYMLSTKTQYAGIAIHKMIIDLFRYLNKRNYFSEFNMIDEGEYWETDDEEVLERKFKEYNDLMDNFSLAIEAIPAEPEETYEDYFKRIAERIHKRRKEN